MIHIEKPKQTRRRYSPPTPDVGVSAKVQKEKKKKKNQTLHAFLTRKPGDRTIMRRRLLDSETSHHPTENAKTQVLAGHEYTIDTNRMTHDRCKCCSIIQTFNSAKTICFQGIAALLVSPILFIAGGIAYVFMRLSPPGVRNSITSIMISKICGKLDKTMNSERTHLLSRVHGRVLDVGCGSGAYMPYLYPNARFIVALEPMVEMHPRIQKSAVQAASKSNVCPPDQNDRLQIYAMNAEEFETTKWDGIPFDWVILGNVLCEVPNVERTVQTVHRLLKTEGHVYFSEHVACPRGTWTRRIQDWMNPYWHTISNGCNINRDSLEIIQKMQQWDVIWWRYKHFCVGLGPMVLGLA
jgi:SAM-dependent methyltransferase